MQNYKAMLSKLDSERSNELISNGSKEHAQALIYQFFDKAKESVNITSKGLSIYNNDEIAEVLNIALNRGVKIKILLDDYQNNKIISNTFLGNCLDSENCEIKTYDKPLKAHIVTRDNNAFRYCDNPGSNIAVASFNRPDVVKNATEKVFGAFFNRQPEYIVA
jgi:HKD family nuclease